MGKRAVFTQADVTRTAKGVLAAGLSPARIEIMPDGRITVTVAAPQSAPRDDFDLVDMRR